MAKIRVLLGVFVSLCILLLVYFFSADRASGELTDMDVMTAAGNALTPVIPEEYVFTQYQTELQKVRVNDEVRRAMKVMMIYSHPQTRERQQYEVYLDRKTGALLGYGTRKVLAPPADVE